MDKFDQIFYQKLGSDNYIKGWRVFCDKYALRTGKQKKGFLKSMTVFYIAINMMFYKVIILFFVSSKIEITTFTFILIHFNQKL